MSWRTVILTKDAKLSLRMNHLVVANETITKIPLVELGVLIIENPNIVVSLHLLNGLADNKITVIICDQKHIPCTTVNGIYGHHRQSKILLQQFNWLDEHKGRLWQISVQQKINNQAKLLEFIESTGKEELIDFKQDVVLHDRTNREGHAAKVYFNRLFDAEFVRGHEDPRNWALNYGYSVLHAIIARTIVSKGYLTEIGIHHINEYNQQNLASDFIEVFRPIVDAIVYKQIDSSFETAHRRALLKMLDKKIYIRNGEYFLPQAIQIYIENCLLYLRTGDEHKLIFPKLEYKKLSQ